LKGNPLHGVESNYPGTTCWYLMDTWESITWSWKQLPRYYMLIFDGYLRIHYMELKEPPPRSLQLHTPINIWIHYMELKV